MNKKTFRIILLMLALLAGFLTGCANSINSPDSTTGGTIAIKVNKPSANDTISYRGQDVSYDLTISSGIKFIELYIDSIYVKNFFPNADGTKPAVRIELDSSYMNKKIKFQLKYYDANGNSAFSSMISVLVMDDRTVPYAPYSIQLLKITSNSYNISWKDSSRGQVAYELWRKAGSAPDFSQYLVTPSGTFNINDDYVDPNQIYYYEVRGVNNYGYSAFSYNVNSVGGGGSINIPAPKLISAFAARTNVVRLTWQINSVTHNYFKIERKNNYTTFDAIGIVPRTATTFSDSLLGLIAGGQYTYRIKAISGTDSSWSNELTVSTPVSDLVSPSITSITNSAPGIVTIKWNSNNDPWADYCLIERKTGSSGTYSQIVQLDSYITAFDDTTAQIGNNYFYRIRKFEVYGQRYSYYSNEVNIIVYQ
jgi:hypothetical protein